MAWTKPTAVILSCTIAIGSALWSPTPADAGAALGLHRAAPVLSGTPIRERKAALAPFSQVLFCKEYPRECRGAAALNAKLDMTADHWQALNDVNRRVNAAIRPKADEASLLGDRWRISPAEGDCDDYAVTKRHLLVGMGWPASALRIAVVRTRKGEGHAVLVVKTRGGDVVLDNLTDQVLDWSATGLTFVKMQSGVSPRLWTAV